MMIKGESIDEEVYEDCGEYVYAVQSFLSSVDLRTGSYLHFPFDGGYYDQPHLMMLFWDICRNEFLLELNKKPSL